MKKISIDESISMLKIILEDMISWDDEEDKMNFILDIVDGYKSAINNKVDIINPLDTFEIVNI